MMNLELAATAASNSVCLGGGGGQRSVAGGAEGLPHCSACQRHVRTPFGAAQAGNAPRSCAHAAPCLGPGLGPPFYPVPLKKAAAAAAASPSAVASLMVVALEAGLTHDFRNTKEMSNVWLAPLYCGCVMTLRA
jgi:hypothetical protein